jgi:hypothetical protein
MSGDNELIPRDTARPSNVAPREKSSRARPADFAQPVGKWLRRIVCVAEWRQALVGLFLTAITIAIGFEDTAADRVLLPIEVLGADGTVASRTVMLPTGQAEPVRSLWLQVHGLRYSDQASVQVNTSAWMPLNNNTVTIAEPGRTYGGIGGGFATLAMTLALPDGAVVGGDNTIRFRFNHTDGFVSSYRVLALNFLDAEGKKILPANDFVEDAPENWTPPLPDAASIRAGMELWHGASLAASTLPNSPTLQAHCADCHAEDGRDLKYFNFSNASIIARARFHGLSKLQSEQIASYIRSLPLPSPGRPWNPPYQPGPGLDQQPVSNWAAGAGLAWVLDQDTDALPYLIGSHGGKNSAPSNQAGKVSNLGALAGQITPEIFRPDGNLNAHEIPIALQLPDWNQWLPRVHPKDAWGPAFSQSEFGVLYDGETPEGRNKGGKKLPLRALLASSQTTSHDLRPVVAGFTQWSEARRSFLGRYGKAEAASPELTNKVYSAQLWQLVKTWEMTQEFGLEGRGRDMFGATADSRTWCNTIPGDAAPAAAHIPNGPAGVGGSALTNEYLTAAWYELQIVLNSGNHQHREREPVDWVYVIAGFLDLQAQTHQPEPARLLVALTKGLQSSDPRLGPDNIKQGWRPNDNIDPRIMISPVWAPTFKPLPVEVHQALTTSMLAAWMDKNLEYPITKHLPVGVPRRPYTQPGYYGDISGGNVWQSAKQFRDAGVPAALVKSLQQWGAAYADRAARIQY